jgi:hypothetical protein
MKLVATRDLKERELNGKEEGENWVMEQDLERDLFGRNCWGRYFFYD